MKKTFYNKRSVETIILFHIALYALILFMTIRFSVFSNMLLEVTIGQLFTFSLNSLLGFIFSILIFSLSSLLFIYSLARERLIVLDDKIIIIKGLLTKIIINRQENPKLDYHIHFEKKMKPKVYYRKGMQYLNCYISPVALHFIKNVSEDLSLPLINEVTMSQLSFMVKMNQRFYSISHQRVLFISTIITIVLMVIVLFQSTIKDAAFVVFVYSLLMIIDRLLLSRREASMILTGNQLCVFESHHDIGLVLSRKYLTEVEWRMNRNTFVFQNSQVYFQRKLTKQQQEYIHSFMRQY